MRASAVRGVLFPGGDPTNPPRKELPVSLLLLILLVVLLVGGLPTWGYSREWGYAPSGTIGLVLVIVLVLMLLGYIPR